jgi:predicted glutamine amidotransferase
MCRLLTFSFKENTNKQDRIECINAFRKLARSGMVPTTIESGHGDGWGLALYKEDEESLNIYKSVAAADVDQEFSGDSFFKEGIGQSGLAHLRKKTVGETSLENTHPFVEGVYSFIHNGTVAKGDGPYTELTSVCQSATDSERLFRKFLQLRENKTTLDAYLEMLKKTKETYPTFTALNTMLHDGKCIYISRVMNTNHPQYESLGLEKYYTLYKGETTDGDVLVASQQLPHKDIAFSLIENNTVVVIDLEKGTQETISLV